MPEKYNDEIDIREIFLSLWERKKLILFITSFAAITSVLYSLSLPNVYTSKSLLAPSAPEDSLTSKIGGLASLSGLAGVNLPSDSSTKSQEGIERMKSFAFFSSFFLPNINLEDLMAVKEWIPETNSLVYDEKLYDEISQKWIRKVSYPKSAIPSQQEAYKVYSDIFTIKQDSKSAFFTLSIDHYSPYVAKQWLDIIITEINNSMLKSDSEQAKKSIDYLTDMTQTTNIQSLQTVISNLLEKEMQTLMLTASNDAYIFKTIDPPIVSEIKSGPARAIICILGTLLGGMLSLIVAFILNFKKFLN